MIKWKFFLPEEGDVSSEVEELEQDAYIRNSLPSNFIHLPGVGGEIWVNPDAIKCISREIIESQKDNKIPDELLEEAE